MFKTITTAAVLLAATAVPALAAKSETFVRDGKTFTYSKVVGKDRVFVHGRDSSGETFDLTIIGSRVTGVSNGVPVSFVVPAAATQIAAR